MSDVAVVSTIIRQSQAPLLEVTDLRKEFPIKRGLMQRTVGTVHAVDGVSIHLNRGETLGIVGESGCGKTTVGRCLLRLIEPTSGRATLCAEGEPVSIFDAGPAALRSLRPQMQMIFQDPQGSLNSRMTVSDIVGEPLIVNHLLRGRALKEKIGELLEDVGLSRSDAARYPHAFSGGQRQRIGIARALALQPALIVADEPVSALDVSVQAQVLNLLAELKVKRSLSYIFIAHDLGVVEHIADRVAVMYLGRIVEQAPARTLFSAPRHPYTEALLSAVPVADPREQRARSRIRLSGEPPSAANPPAGCRFHPRCPYAQDRCRTEVPQLRPLSTGVTAACHFAEDLQLRGVNCAV